MRPAAAASDSKLASEPTQVFGFIDAVSSALPWQTAPPKHATAMTSATVASEAKSMEEKSFDPNESDSNWTWTSRDSKPSLKRVSTFDAKGEVQCDNLEFTFTHRRCQLVTFSRSLKCVALSSESARSCWAKWAEAW